MQRRIRGADKSTRGASAASGAAPSLAPWPLLALNFFMADMQAGIGPFLGVYLLAHGWNAGYIGTVMTVGGVAGMIMTAPAGALIDQARNKRIWVIVAGIAAIAASAVVLLSQNFWVVAASQVGSAVAGAAIIPAVNAITLGIVRQRGFNRQNGRNQAFNHAGNMVGAALSGYVGWKLGYPAIFALAAVFGVLSIASVLMIPAKSIDYAAARGLKSDDDGAKASGFRVLAECKPLLVLAAALCAFHLGNGAMLPLYGLAVVSGSEANGPGFVAETIVIAQATMIVASIVAMRMAETRGYWIVLLISFLALPVRGLLAANLLVPWGVYPVQILDGVGAGLQSVAVPGLVARILNGTGRVNVGQGAVMTAQGVGAALSPALGGWIAQVFGYPAMFLTLGSFALVSIGLWLLVMGSSKSMTCEAAA
jgi:MFS family permease